MTAKFFDTEFTCDGTMYTYIVNVMIMFYFLPKSYYYVYFSVHFLSESMSLKYLQGLYPPVGDL